MNGLLACTSARELREWEIWYEQNPCGDEALFAQIAMLIAVVANMFRGKGDKAHDIKDFLISELMRPKKQMSGREMADYFKNLTQMMGGDIVYAGNQ